MKSDELCLGQDVLGLPDCISEPGVRRNRNLGKLCCDGCVGSVLELAFTDELTGLPNRRGVIHLFNSLVRSGAVLGALTTDLSNFKFQNDTFGHSQGDELLINTAKFLKSELRVGDLAFRFGNVPKSQGIAVGRRGGDEFVALIDLSAPRTDVNLSLEERMQAVVERLEASFDNYLPIREHNAQGIPVDKQLSLKTGWAIREQDESLASLIHRADIDGSIPRLPDLFPELSPS